MGKKNLDKLFQEKFSDFKEIPNEKVWDTISASLDNKKSRRLIPFWWKLGGVAALLAVLLVIINPFVDETTVAPVITDTEKTEKVQPVNQEDSNGIPPEESSREVDQVVDIETIESKADSNFPENQESEETKTPIDTKKSSLITTKSNQDKASQLATSDSRKTTKEKEPIASVGNKESFENSTKSKETLATVDNEASVENPKKESERNIPSERLPTAIGIENSVEEGVVDLQKEKKDVPSEVSDKKSIFDEIEEQNEEEEALAGRSKDRWSVGANLAPVYFSSFGEGSPIDPAFSANSKSGDLNMSYGLSIAYGVSDKLSIRTGINRVDFGYDTNEVEFSASLQGSLSGRLNNVNYTASSENVVVESKADNSFALAENKGSEDVITNDISRNGIMAQEFGYIEVPVELDYALVDNRFGVNLVGGVSTMFLTNNSVVLNDSNETIELGQANNLNNVNFSTNVGFGLNYKFTPKIRLNVEPVFKYQLNTFSDTSGSFNPFSVGLYSGLNFRF
ncbi:MAG: outer membrane beta-barrel protein [Aurantibacter sp.]